MKKSIILFFTIISITTFSQVEDYKSLDYINYSRKREYTIEEIKISGLKYLNPDVLVNLSGLKIGNKITIPGDDISKAIDNYWKHGLFSDVKIVANKIEGDKIFLEIYLQEQPRVSKLVIEDINKNEREDIEEKIELKRNSQINDNVINTTTTIIKNHFIEKGFLNTDVNFYQKDDTIGYNRVIVTIDIRKNKKVKVKNISFEGNNEFSDKRLRRVMKNTKKKNLNILKASKYIESDFDEDIESLISFYNKKGFRDAKILNTDVFPVNKRRIGIKINLYEGNLYHIRSISWIGNTKYNTELLNKVLGIKKGEVYDKTRIEERINIDEDAVSSLYMDNGYLFFGIEPVEVNIENDSVDLEMQVYEGKPATVNKVIIRGNTKTNEHVARRELYTRPGELFSKSDIIRSVRELANLGHFNPENIVPNPIPNPTDGTVDLEYQLEERANDQLEVSGGWGGFGFIGSVGVRFSNFSTKNLFQKKAWKPVPSGDGQTLSIRAQSNGSYYQNYNVQFIEPWFGGKKPNSLSISSNYSIIKEYGERTVENKDSYFKIIGFSIGMGHRLKWPDDHFSFYNEFGIQRYKLNEWEGQFIVSDGVVTTFSVKTALSRSSIDQMLYPRRGSSITLSIKATPPYSLFRKKNFWKFSNREINEALQLNPNVDEVFNAREKVEQSEYLSLLLKGKEEVNKYKLLEYHKWNFKSALYTTIIGNLVLATKAEFGYLGFYNRRIGYSPFEKFELGGSGMYYGNYYYGNDIVALRGYKNNSITPKSPFITQNGIYRELDNGNIYTKYTTELRYLISPNPSAMVYGLIFFEGGNAWTSLKNVNPFLVKRAVGIGMRAFLPMFGMLGVDYCIPFDANDFNKEPLQFILGQQF